MRKFSRYAAALVVLAAALMPAAPPAHGAPEPAGATAALLSVVDAAAGRVEVVRHWHGAGGEDMQVYPFTAYFWNSCLPGDGAIMMLLVGPGYDPPIGTSAEAYADRSLVTLGRRTVSGLAAAPQARGNRQLDRIIAGMTTPGDPAYEVLKTGAMWVNDVSHYESYGYAVFLMIRWKWVWPFPGCRADIVTVPEGYGIPFVR